VHSFTTLLEVLASLASRARVTYVLIACDPAPPVPSQQIPEHTQPSYLRIQAAQSFKTTLYFFRGRMSHLGLAVENRPWFGLFVRIQSQAAEPV
jgi:hypothetical protein